MIKNGAIRILEKATFKRLALLKKSVNWLAILLAHVNRIILFQPLKVRNFLINEEVS